MRRQVVALAEELREREKAIRALAAGGVDEKEEADWTPLKLDRDFLQAKVQDIDERNKALAVGRELGLDLSKLNVNGGAIALGHPLAATGVRLTVTLARELRRSGLRYGISSACVGGDQGIALLIENPLAT